MRILVDTNVLISTFVFGGKTGLLIRELIEQGHSLIITEYIDQEFHDKLTEKWPDKAETVYSLFHQMAFSFCESTSSIRGNLRDPKDLPVLSDGIYHHVDVILTGDRDFLDAEVGRPLIFSPTMLYDYLHR